MTTTTLKINKIALMEKLFRCYREELNLSVITKQQVNLVYDHEADLLNVVLLG